MSTDDQQDTLDELRRQAERVLDEQPGEEGGASEYRADPQALILELQRQRHELQVHQVELQLQMEQLVHTNVELERTRAEFADLFDFAPIGYLTLDRSGMIQRANLTATAQLGAPRETLARKRLSAFVDPAHVSSFALFLRRVFEAPIKRTVELRLRSAAGDHFYAQLEGLAAGDEDGPPSQCRVAIIDITAQREAQEEVLRLNTTLEERVEQRTTHIRELSEELETFVYSVTHDLETPLRHIRTFTDRLGQVHPAGDDDQARYAQHVRNSVDRMEHLLNALLTFFRISRQRVKFVPVDLNRVLKEVLKDLQGELASRNVELTIAPLPTVTGDSGTLQVVFLNLLANALKFTRDRDPARIHICAQETEQEYIVGVEDNGVGFNMRQKGRLFGLFQRLHSERDFEGTGVGLAQVRRIVLRHGGRVWAEGKPGQGATFWFSLPKRAPFSEDTQPRGQVKVEH
ncbi:sensor histidine kinase [Deinococcus aluminii]|uniref:histidine kinase n=1 Tax=Deinococcus aluminii TaxID=1656885 RepID=A0ABP9XFK7_9DEIO